jgi:peptidoglycan/xylan/chitin deacetylase (PgdA/CDA1 family)
MGQHPYLYLRYPGFLSKALTLSYDDGVVADLRLMEILNANGIKCTFNLNSGLFGLGTRLPEDKIIGHYVASAHEIAVHGYKHLALSALQAPALIAEILEDRKNLEALTGAPVTGMAYAYGDFDDRVVSLLADCGITYSRTVTSTHAFSLPTKPLLWDPTCHHNDPRLMELAKRFAEEKTYRDEPALFYLWGHAYEFDEKHNNNWEVIEKFAAYIGGREDIFYATNGEIMSYISAYNALVFDVDGRSVYNPTATDVYLHINEKDTVAKAGEVTALI